MNLFDAQAVQVLIFLFSMHCFLTSITLFMLFGFPPFQFVF
jgi:hypothetical protein